MPAVVRMLTDAQDDHWWKVDGLVDKETMIGLTARINRCIIPVRLDRFSSRGPGMRQTGLFPGEELPEEELLRRLEPILPKLWDMVRVPFDDLLDRRTNDSGFRVLDEGETAQWLRPQIIERARNLFEGDDKVKVLRRNSQTYLRYADNFAIVPKKLRRKRKSDGLTFSSYNTLQNVALWAQKAKDGLPELPRLVVGYVFMAEMTDIKIWIAYPRGKDAGVYVLMPDQEGGLLGVYDPGPQEAPIDEDKGFHIKPKKADKPETGET